MKAEVLATRSRHRWKRLESSPTGRCDCGKRRSECGSRMGLFTKTFCTSPEEALAMAEVGVDNIIVHFGNSSGGTIGSKTVLAEDAARKRAGAVLDALSDKFSDRVVTCHGGAIETSADFERFLRLEPRLHEYVGDSSDERFPIETSVVEAARQFKSVKLPKAS